MEEQEHFDPLEVEPTGIGKDGENALMSSLTLTSEGSKAVSSLAVTIETRAVR